MHTEAMLGAGSIEEGLRASAREMATYAREHPGWTGVSVESWTHALRRPELRRRVAGQHERLLDSVGGLVQERPRTTAELPGPGPRPRSGRSIATAATAKFKLVRSTATGA